MNRLIFLTIVQLLIIVESSVTGISIQSSTIDVDNNNLENSKEGGIYLEENDNPLASSGAECRLCQVTFWSIIKLKEKSISPTTLRKIITSLCASLKFEAKRVCDGIVQYDLDIFLYVLNNGKNVTAGKICSLLMEKSCKNQFNYFNWSIDIPAKPSRIPDKVVSNDEKPLRILHVTDVHVDPLYKFGGRANCEETVCCQSDQGDPVYPERGCGYWGDYRTSDIPERTFQNALMQMKTHKIDYVYFTGDIVPHRVWSTSVSNNSKLEERVMDSLRNNFNVPVLFVLGNHEPHPVNAYAPLKTTADLSTEWLFDQLSDELKALLSQEELENIKRGGYYNILLRKGFRVVILNNNICITENLWLIYEDYDLYGQLAWLIKVLLQAEADGEYVHILHHVPTGDISCLGTWGREFTRIINRFADTVSAQFSGHTHLDEFFLYYNESASEEAIHVAYNGASLTTFTNMNPSYKIYDIDPLNFEVSDLEEWTFNLTAANLNGEIAWYKLYSFREIYPATSMKPYELGKMVEFMAGNKTLLDIYNKYRYRLGDGAEEFCDDDCHKSNLCTIVTSDLSDESHCEKIKKIYDNGIKIA